MSDLVDAIDRYLDSLRQANASPHTLRNYSADLAQFADYFSPPDTDPPAPSQIDSLQLREWLGGLYQRGLDPISTRRKLACVRSLFKFLLPRRNHSDQRRETRAHAEEPEARPLRSHRGADQYAGRRSRRRYARPSSSRTRPAAVRASLRLRPPHQRTRRTQSHRLRYGGALDPSPRQRSQGTPDTIRQRKPPPHSKNI